MPEQIWFAAPAKINLALHVTGRREDGYHTIETIAAFAGIGDRIGVGPAPTDVFRMTGPEAVALLAEDPSTNLVVRARDHLRHLIGARGRNGPPVAITLEKNLLAGSGIGGGSADAASTLAALTRLWDAGDLEAAIAASAVKLGADVPMCLASRPLLASGVGEIIRTVANLPPLPLVLANPRRHVSTPAVFQALERKNNSPLPIGESRELRSTEDWAAWLAGRTRNDLAAPSVALEPAIGLCLDAIASTRPLLARMSGSGATCFGIYADTGAALAAASALLQQHPDWWITATETGASPGVDP